VAVLGAPVPAPPLPSPAVDTAAEADAALLAALRACGVDAALDGLVAENRRGAEAPLLAMHAQMVGASRQPHEACRRAVSSSAGAPSAQLMQRAEHDLAAARSQLAALDAAVREQQAKLRDALAGSRAVAAGGVAGDAAASSTGAPSAAAAAARGSLVAAAALEVSRRIAVCAAAAGAAPPRSTAACARVDPFPTARR